MRYPGIILASFFIMVMIGNLPVFHAAYGQLLSLSIEEVQFKEIYAVEYRSYAKESIGKITIYNPTSEKLKVSVVLSGERYINAPMKMTAELPAERRTDIPLYVDLDMRVLELGRQVEHIPVSIEMVAYLGGMEVFNPDVIDKHITLYDRHKMPDGDPSKIAMFVDPKDKYVTSEFSTGIRKTSAAEGDKAETAFAFLQKKGIYCVGPGSSQIQYPRELLRIRLGSIYDGSLLYVTILESMGVETKLIFNSNVMLPLYKQQGKWCPVDMNMLPQSFQAARLSGEKLQKNMSSNGTQSVVLRDAWKKYNPLRFPVLAPEDMSLLESADRYIKEEKLNDAAEVFHQLLKKYPDDPVLLNSAANVDILGGDAVGAVKKYARAADQAPDDSGLYLNMGLAYHRMGDERKSMEGFTKACVMLGNDITAVRSKLNLDRNSQADNEIYALLVKAIRRNMDSDNTALGARNLPLRMQRLERGKYPLYWKRFHE